MKSRFRMLLAAITFFAALALPLRLAAQDKQDHNRHLVRNPGFETGNFTGWTLSGDTSYCHVITQYPHSGTFSAELGPQVFPTSGFLDQTITTVVGQLYHVDFWLANIGNVTPRLNAFSASFAGVRFYSVVNPPAFPFTNFSANITATSTSSDLHFAFFNRADHLFSNDWYFDYVSVTAVPALQVSATFCR